MGKMGGAFFDCPIFHSVCHHIGHRRIQAAALGDGAVQRIVGFLGQTLAHHRVAKHHAAKHFGNLFHHHYLLITDPYSFFTAEKKIAENGFSDLSRRRNPPETLRSKSLCLSGLPRLVSHKAIKKRHYGLLSTAPLPFSDVRIIIPDRSSCQAAGKILFFFIKNNPWPAKFSIPLMRHEIFVYNLWIFS